MTGRYLWGPDRPKGPDGLFRYTDAEWNKIWKLVGRPDLDEDETRLHLEFRADAHVVVTELREGELSPKGEADQLRHLAETLRSARDEVLLSATALKVSEGYSSNRSPRRCRDVGGVTRLINLLEEKASDAEQIARSYEVDSSGNRYRLPSRDSHYFLASLLDDWSMLTGRPPDDGRPLRDFIVACARPVCGPMAATPDAVRGFVRKTIRKREAQQQISEKTQRKQKAKMAKKRQKMTAR